VLKHCFRCWRYYKCCFHVISPKLINAWLLSDTLVLTIAPYDPDWAAVESQQPIKSTHEIVNKNKAITCPPIGDSQGSLP